MKELQLFGGFARTDITPELGILLMGYPDPDRKAESVRDPLQANALVLKQGETTAVLISLTICILEDTDVERIRLGILEQTGIDAERIVVSTIQTHSAPCTMTCWGWCDKDETYVDLIVNQSIKAAVKASQNLKEIQVGFGKTESDVGVNRRVILADHSVALGNNPWGIYDPEMTVVCFQSADGPLATLIHYGAHPTVFTSKSRAISRDWPGVMIDRVEDLTGAPALFVNACSGRHSSPEQFPRCGRRWRRSIARGRHPGGNGCDASHPDDQGIPQRGAGHHDRSIPITLQVFAPGGRSES